MRSLHVLPVAQSGSKRCSALLSHSKDNHKHNKLPRVCSCSVESGRVDEKVGRKKGINVGLVYMVVDGWSRHSGRQSLFPGCILFATMTQVQSVSRSSECPSSEWWVLGIMCKHTSLDYVTQALPTGSPHWLAVGMDWALINAVIHSLTTVATPSLKYCKIENVTINSPLNQIPYSPWHWVI